MTENEYIAKKTAILMRMQEAVFSLQRTIEQATDALLTLEKEYRGLRAPMGSEECIKCQIEVPSGTPCCAVCAQKIREVEERYPALGADLLAMKRLANEKPINLYIEKERNNGR